MGWVSDLLGLPPKKRTVEELRQDLPEVIKINGKIFKNGTKGHRTLRKGCKKLKEKLQADPNIIDIAERAREMMNVKEEGLKMIDEKMNGQAVVQHQRKQTHPTKYKPAPKKKRPAKKQVQLKEDPEVIDILEEPQPFQELEQELQEATEALVKSSERFDALMKYYDTMPEKIDGPVDLAWLEAHVAPEKERFDVLMEYYMKHFPWHIDGRVDLAFLETHVAPVMEGRATPAPSLDTILKREPKPALKRQDAFVQTEEAHFTKPAPETQRTVILCPFHEETELKFQQINDSVTYFYCPIPTCPVWCTQDKAHIILMKLLTDTHEEVRHRLQSFAPLKCHCILTPKMRLSQTEKNFERVYLTCGQRLSQDACRYFQWMDAPLWKPKPAPFTFGDVRDQAVPLGFNQKIQRAQETGIPPTWSNDVGGKPFGDPIWLGKRKERDFDSEMSRKPKVQQLIPYAGEHPADQFLSTLGEDLRAERRAQEEKAFKKRCDQENEQLL